MLIIFVKKLKILDIFVPRVENNYCHLSHKKSYSGRNGFTIFINGKIVVSHQEHLDMVL